MCRNIYFAGMSVVLQCSFMLPPGVLREKYTNTEELVTILSNNLLENLKIEKKQLLKNKKKNRYKIRDIDRRSAIILNSSW